MATRSMISFDWAMKRLLRNKANYEVLEGFLSELLCRKIIIKHIGESESNRKYKTDKWNRVDILVEADGSEMVVIELQFDSQDDYFLRMLYGASKVITEYIREGDSYGKVRKVYSINIVYFDLGRGDDYVYHGVTRFTGLYTHTELKLTDHEHQVYRRTVGDLYPEYYIIKVPGFNEIATNTLDEWIYYLKTNTIKDEFTAKGLDRARQILVYDNLSDDEKKDYERNVEERRIRDSEIRTSFREGHAEGEAKGRAEEQKESMKKINRIAVTMFKKGMTIEEVSDATGLSKQQIEKLVKP